MSIQRQIVLRYRSSGHVRFDMPLSLCDAAVAKRIETGLLANKGLYRVRMYRRSRKLSIQYDETLCGFTKLAKYLYRLVDDLEKEGAFKPANTPSSVKTWKPAEKIRNSKISRWFAEKFTATRETVQAARVIGKMSLKKPKALVKDPETTIINFLNDILVLYVIKIHWKRITQQWIPHPFQYRYEWTAAFYLIFLLVRSRRPKK